MILFLCCNLSKFSRQELPSVTGVARTVKVPPSPTIASSTVFICLTYIFSFWLHSTDLVATLSQLIVGQVVLLKPLIIESHCHLLRGSIARSTAAGLMICHFCNMSWSWWQEPLNVGTGHLRYTADGLWILRWGHLDGGNASYLLRQSKQTVSLYIPCFATVRFRGQHDNTCVDWRTPRS